MDEQLSAPVPRKSEVTIISGFLGAGKTTLLKKILTWESDLSDTVVIVNEFGDAGIDGSLLKNVGSDVVELTGGCICCTMKVDLNQTLKKIRREFNPRKIFIESTGVADPFITTVTTDLRGKIRMTWGWDHFLTCPSPFDLMMQLMKAASSCSLRICLGNYSV